jgi:hypothetical protein
MKVGMTMIESPKDLIEWGKMNVPHIRLTDQGAGLLLAYMEDNEIMLYFGADGGLKQCDRLGEITDTTMDDVIDMVCEWNYEAIEDTGFQMKHPRDYLEYCNASNREKELKKEQTILDLMFEDTKYGRDIEKVASLMAKEMIERLSFIPIINIPMLDDNVFLKNEEPDSGILMEEPENFGMKEETIPTVQEEIAGRVR